MKNFINLRSILDIYYNHDDTGTLSGPMTKRLPQNWFSRNETKLRQQLILFCSTPYFKQYSKQNPEICNHFYEISKLINYGVGNVDDFNNPNNEPFKKLMAVGFKDIRFALFNYKMNLENKELLSSSKYKKLENNKHIFKNNFHIFLITLEAFFRRTEPNITNLKMFEKVDKATIEIYQAYLNKNSIISKILMNIRKEPYSHVKVKDIYLDTANKYANEIVCFTNQYSNLRGFFEGTFEEFLDISEKALCVSQFLNNNIQDINYKNIVKNNFHYQQKNTSIFSKHPEFFMTAMLYLIQTTDLDVSLINSIGNQFCFSDEKTPEPILEIFNDSLNNIRNNFLSLNLTPEQNVSDEVKEMSIIEQKFSEITKYSTKNKERDILDFFSQAQNFNLNFNLKNFGDLLREGRLNSLLAPKTININKKTKI